MPCHLSGALQDYFMLSGQTPLPDRLTILLDRIDAALAAAGERLATGFRDELIRALPALRTFAMSLCASAARADDLVQETLVRAWANRERFIPGTNFTAWTFTILRNQFYSEMRKARREVEDAESTHAAGLTAAPDQEHVVALGSVMNLIGTLPLPQRQALLLVGAEGFTYEEAAAQLGCQVGTVKSRISRARSFLVASLAQDASSLGFAGL
nr:sigma-70 family RNA polymerase sigma factor [Methylobacterium radiodurans]